MSAASSEFAAYAELLPEGAMPLAGVRLCDYIAQDGDTRFHFKADGEQSLSQTIGMLIRAAIAYALEDEDAGGLPRD